MCKAISVVVVSLLFVSACHAAYLLELDTDGMDDGVVVFNSGFSFGGDTTTASQSSASTAFGMTGGDSIFGGDGAAEADTYVYTYNPGIDGDNLSAPAGTDLGDGNTATGITAGDSGTYAVYATWPFTSNVSGGDTQFTITADGATDVNTLVDQNNGTDGLGDVWIKIGEIDYTSGAIVVTQQPSVTNSFVSMRSAGVLFEPVPEPSSIALAAIACLGLISCRRRRRA